jgi:hypothetical protein
MPLAAKRTKRGVSFSETHQTRLDQEWLGTQLGLTF